MTELSQTPEGDLPKNLPTALTNLDDLLRQGAEVDRDRVRAVVTVIEGYTDVPAVVPHHEADAFGTGITAKRALSDPRLESLGITTSQNTPSEEVERS